MTKTCTVCLREFETKCHTAKYCPNCRTGSRRYVQRQYRRKKQAVEQERLRLERQQIIAKLFERRTHQ